MMMSLHHHRHLHWPKVHCTPIRWPHHGHAPTGSDGACRFRPNPALLGQSLLDVLSAGALQLGQKYQQSLQIGSVSFVGADTVSVPGLKLQAMPGGAWYDATAVRALTSAMHLPHMPTLPAIDADGSSSSQDKATPMKGFCWFEVLPDSTALQVLSKAYNTIRVSASNVSGPGSLLPCVVTTRTMHLHLHSDTFPMKCDCCVAANTVLLQVDMTARFLDL